VVSTIMSVPLTLTLTLISAVVPAIWMRFNSNVPPLQFPRNKLQLHGLHGPRWSQSLFLWYGTYVNELVIAAAADAISREWWFELNLSSRENQGSYNLCCPNNHRTSCQVWSTASIKFSQWVMIKFVKWAMTLSPTLILPWHASLLDLAWSPIKELLRNQCQLPSTQPWPQVADSTKEMQSATTSNNQQVSQQDRSSHPM
jgi:hypothetical protein